MPIPLTFLQIAKDLLLFTPSDVGLDALVASEWDQQRDAICREFDLFVFQATIATTANKSIYTVPVGTTRIVSVIYNGTALGFTDRATLDLRDPSWETALPGRPKLWAYNALPGEVDTPAAAITPRDFLITPAPDGANASPTAILLIGENLQATVPLWVEPILLYRTVSQIASENTNLFQPEKGQWFNQLADFWLQTARKQMQV